MATTVFVREDRFDVRRFLTVATMLVVFAAGRDAPAQDIDDDEPEVAAPVEQQFMVAEENFDQWVFGGGRNTASARSRLDSLLTLQVEEIDRTCGITPVQKKKLLLAGRGDVKRYFGRVEEKRRKFQLVRNDANKFQAFFQELQPFQHILQQGTFGDGSLFAKTLKHTLDDRQAARHEQDLRERRQFRYRAKVDLVIAMLDSAVGLTADQRRRLSKLLAEETRPPKKFGPQDYMVVMLQVSRLPEATLKPIFNEFQWRLLGLQFDYARAMEPTLRKNGYLPDEPAKPRPLP